MNIYNPFGSTRGISIFLLFVLTCISSTVSHSQEKNVIRGNQQWFQYYNQTKLSDKWSLLIDGGFRWRTNFETKSQYLIRSALGYSPNPHIRIAAGFANLGVYVTQNFSKIEYRPYQEISTKHKYSKIELTNRLRVEERFINSSPNSNYQTPSTFNFRFRYAFMVSLPLLNLSKSDTDKKLILNLGDELFLNAGKNIVYNVFDQNRFIVAPTFKHSKNLSVGLAWNSLFGGTNSPSTYVYQNVVWLQVKHKLDFSSRQI